MDAVSRHGGHRLASGAIDALTRAAFKPGDDGKLHVNKDLVGQDPAVLARHAGSRSPTGRRSSTARPATTTRSSSTSR
jgi:aldehyde dehydrogenase